MRCCCNELNCGYAADGYTRVRGLGAIIVAHGVGSLSCVNAVAGAYAERLPLIVVAGGLNSKAQTNGEIVHHSLAVTEFDRYDYVLNMYKHITAEAVTVKRPADLPMLLHRAVKAALQHSRPVFVDIASNIVNMPIIGADPENLVLPLRRTLSTHMSDPHTLKAALEHAIQIMNASKQPIIIVGQLIRQFTLWHELSVTGGAATNVITDFLTKTHYAFAVMPDAKAMVPEDLNTFLGIYLGAASMCPGETPHMHTAGAALQQTAADSDLMVMLAPLLSDYATAGHTTVFKSSQTISIHLDTVNICGSIYHEVYMKDFLQALVDSDKLQQNHNTMDVYHHNLTKCAADNGWAMLKNDEREAAEKIMKNFPFSTDTNALITSATLHVQLQHFVQEVNNADKALHLVVECGDSWFHGLKLKLPPPNRLEIQMQCGSIGWSVGATFGLSQALSKKNPNMRVLGIIGDGSFQMSAQELSTMIRYELNPIIVIIANRDYVIEKLIHEGPYNRISHWRHTELVHAWNRGISNDGVSKQPLSFHVTTASQLRAALTQSMHHWDRLSLIEVELNSNDNHIELGLWASQLSTHKDPTAPSDPVDFPLTPF